MTGSAFRGVLPDHKKSWVSRVVHFNVPVEGLHKRVTSGSTLGKTSKAYNPARFLGKLYDHFKVELPIYCIKTSRHGAPRQLNCGEGLRKRTKSYWEDPLHGPSPRWYTSWDPHVFDLKARAREKRWASLCFERSKKLTIHPFWNHVLHASKDWRESHFSGHSW